MSADTLTTLLGNLVDTVLAGSMTLITRIDFAWASEQAVAFVTKLHGTWGDFASWTSEQLSKLGSVLANLPSEFMILLDDLALSKATNLVKFGAKQLGNLAAKLVGMPVAVLKIVLDSFNGTAFCEGLAGITRDYLWAPDTTSTFIAKLISPEVCGSLAQWTAEKIGALGSMINSLDVQSIMDMSSLAFAKATNLAMLTAETLGKLG